jgi:hypothetical protein
VRYLVASALVVCPVFAMFVACGGEKPPEPKSPEPVATASAEPTMASTAPAAGTAPEPAASIPPAVAPAAEAKILSFERSKESGKIDKVGKADGALKPDGEKDAVFTLKVSGPIDAIFVASVDKKGDSLGEFQADSLVGSQVQPNELAVAKAGKLTLGVAAFEGDKLLNAADGSLTGAIGAGEHTLTIYLANVPNVKPGKPLRVWVQMPDHTVVAGPTLTK